MQTRLRWVVVGAMVVVGVPAARLWGWSTLLGGLGPRKRTAPQAVAGPPPEVVASVAQVALPAPATLPVTPRADYRPLPGRIAPRPVRPGEPAEGDGAAGVVALPPAPPPGAWEKVEIVSPFGVGTPAPGVTAAVRSGLRPRLAECFDRTGQGRWATLGRAYSTVAPGEAASAGPAILLLEVEEEGGGLRVVDAPVERRGSASDGTLNCAQGVLRGVRLEAPSEGKKRFRMRLQLRP